MLSFKHPRVVLMLMLLGVVTQRSAAQEPEPEKSENPYLAPAELSTEELVEFLDRMQQKPATIRRGRDSTTRFWTRPIAC